MDNLRLHTHVRHDAPYPVLVVAGEIDVFTAPLFKQAVGVPVHRYVVESRVEIGLQMLAADGTEDRHRASAEHARGC